MDLVVQRLDGGLRTGLHDCLVVHVMGVLEDLMGHLGEHLPHLLAPELGELVIHVANPVVVGVLGLHHFVSWRLWNLK